MNTIENIYNLYKKNYLVSTDTRNIIPDSIFFALKGENFNGNKFAIEAINKGASWAICDENIFEHEKIILVEDVLKTLQDVAVMHRNSLSIPIIGITGTNGKTTTKELIYSVLSSKYNVQATKGNLNNHIGVPLTILSIMPFHEIAIVEMGANHIGEIAELCEISKPTHGIITNIGKAHLEGFGSIEGIIQTKKALYDYILKTKGNLFVDFDSNLLSELSIGSSKITYGTNGGDVQGEIINNIPYLTIKANNQLFNTHIVGAYNLKNILAAISIGYYFNLSYNEIQFALVNYIPSNNRSQFVETNTNKIILDAYNANPSSMMEAIKNMENINHDKKVLILGDMLELGEYSLMEHQNIIEKVEEINPNLAIFVGDMFMKADISKTHLCFKTNGEAIKYISANPIQDAIILIKGSRGIKMESLLPYISL